MRSSLKLVSDGAALNGSRPFSHDSSDDHLFDAYSRAVRGWAVRLLVENGKTSEVVTTRLTDLARQDKSAWVRLALASALQRLPLDQRWAIADALAAHAEDAGDRPATVRTVPIR